jgi:hypothetical protein
VTIGAARARWPSSLPLVATVALLAGLAALSMLLVAPAPSYDPWAWLLWGRELAGGELDTREGPAFKPLPVAVSAALSPAGGAAPWLWVGLVRLAALVSLWLAFRLARRLSGGSRLAGALAALSVALCGSFLDTAAAGAETPLVLALALAGAEAWRGERLGLALACGVGCALLRVEAWPFLAAAGVVMWRRQPGMRPALAVAAVLLPAAWIVPELLASGDPLRSAERARTPNPGQPALAELPSLAALEQAVRLPLWCLWIGVLVLVVDARRGAARPALALVAAGGAWMLLVAVMAEFGFSGEPRYSLPAAALVAIGGAVGLSGLASRSARPEIAVAAVALVALAALPRLDAVRAVQERQAHQWALASDLPEAIEAAGGRETVLACGRPYVGPLRGPLAAYRLEVAKPGVEPDLPPRPPGVVFRSSLSDGGEPEPEVGSGFARVGRRGSWEVWSACES